MLWVIGFYVESGKNDVCGFCLFDCNVILFFGGVGIGMSYVNLYVSFGGGDILLLVFVKVSEFLIKGVSIMFLSGDG